MKKWSRLGLVVLTALAVIATVIYWFGFPEVEAIYPPEGNDSVAAGESIRLSFTRSMQMDSVLERLSIRPVIDMTPRWDGNTLVIDPLQPWQPGTVVEVELAAGARASGILSFPVQEGIAWSFTIRQPRLLFLYPATGAANIYSLDMKTLEREPLTDRPEGIEDFSVSHEGSVLYFSANNSQGGSDLYRLNLASEQLVDGSSAEEQALPALILECLDVDCRMPVASPKGDYLAFERTEQLGFPRVWLLPLSGQEDLNGPAVRTEDAILAGDPAHQTLLPSWSIDGLLAFYDTQAAAFVIYDPYSGDRVLFPNQTGQRGDWHPAGREFLAPEIFFLNAGSVTGLQNFANSHLILFDRLTNSTSDLTPADDMEDSSPSFSPDGSYLAFARKYLDQYRWTPGRQLWVMMPETGQAQAITDDSYYTHYEFAWSPDSKLLAYVRFNQTLLTNPPEIWLLELLNVERTLLVENGYWPQWIP
ncbi:MAG TPA: Ig-like domain-containing protein [Anaerolineales bacterium]|nr:Ig-like domain-containing protein [Anaerolineales bacterium]